MSEGRYRRIFANDWHDPAFRTLNDGVRVVFLYVKAGPQTTSVGCFRFSTAVAIEDLGGSTESFEERLKRVCEVFHWGYDPLARVVWISDWFASNPPANPNVVQSWVKLMKNVPDCDVRTDAIASIGESLKNLPATFREPWKDLLKSFPRSESEPESHQGSGIGGSGKWEQASGREGNGESHISIKVRAIAQKAVNFCGVQESPTAITQIFWQFWNADYPNATANRDHVHQAITVAISDKRERQKATA